MKTEVSLSMRSLLLPFSAVVLRGLAQAEIAPFTDGMTRGQGYNSYLQAGCVHDAVTIEGDADQSQAAQITYDSQLITSYSKIARLLDISAAASISYLENSADAKAKFLDRTEYEESDLTYVVRVDVQKQPSSRNHYSFNWNNATFPQETYCDRFISDFVTGGAFYARVSVRYFNEQKKQEVEAALKVAMSMFSAKGEISSEVKVAVESLQKNSEITATTYYVGAPPDVMAELAAQDDNPLILQIKEQADSFLAAAKQHDWNRYALLEKYGNVVDFNGAFRPLDYTQANELSWDVSNDYSHYITSVTAIRQIEAENFKGGANQRRQLQTHGSDALQIYRDWISNVTSNPAAAKTSPIVESPSAFYQLLQDAVQRNYIAQRIPGRESSDFIDTVLHNGSQKLFELANPVLGPTSKLAFGQTSAGTNPSYRFAVGDNLPAGFKQTSALYLGNKLGSSTNQIISVFSASMEGSSYVLLQLDNPNPPAAERKWEHWGDLYASGTSSIGNFGTNSTLFRSTTPPGPSGFSTAISSLTSDASAAPSSLPA